MLRQLAAARSAWPLCETAMSEKQARATLLVTFLMFVVSLAVYSREYTGWRAPGEYDINVTHTAMGVPHWLIVNKIEIEGSPPPIDARYLPDADRYAPGWHVKRVWLLTSLTLCTGITALLVWGLSRVTVPRTRWPYGSPLAVAVVVGMVVPTEPQWVGALFGIAFLMLSLVLASVIGRSYVYASLSGFAALVLLWASNRLADVFSSKHMHHGMPGKDDLMGLMVFGPVMIGLAVLATLAGRLVWRDRQHNHRMHAESGVGPIGVDSQSPPTR